MYCMKLDPTQVAEMYRIREDARERGERLPIAKQVKEAIEEYITKNTNKKSLSAATGRLASRV